MSNKARERKSYSQDFKLRMLKEYYESGSTKYSLCKKYSVSVAGKVILSQKRYLYRPI